MFLETVMRPRSKLIDVLTGPGDTDNWRIESATLHHGLKGRENFLIRQVARCAKKDEGVRMGIAHRFSS